MFRAGTAPSARSSFGRPDRGIRLLTPDDRPMSTEARAPGTVSIRNFRGEIRVRGEQTAGGATLVEHTLPPGFIAMPLHTHRRETETTYVLEGTLWVQVGRRVTKVGAGQAIVKPVGVPHTYWNEGRHPARFLDVVTPGG